jgi:hypothetical protein
MSVQLSALGVSNLSVARFEKDFTFIVGEAHYRVPQCIAVILSRPLAVMSGADPTLCEYRVHTNDDGNYFNDVLRLCDGCEIPVTRANRQFWFSLAEEFENPDLASHCFEGSISIDCAPEWFVVKRRLHIDYSRELEFLAAHFGELPDHTLRSLNVAMFGEVLSHPSFVVISEDYLYRIIVSQLDRGDEYFALFEHVLFTWLSGDIMDDFVDLTGRYLEMMTPTLWDRIGLRLRIRVPCPTAKMSRFRPNFPVDGNGSLRGIIAHLTGDGGNVANRGIVDITSKTDYPSAGYRARNLADLANDSFFCSSGAQNEAVTFDFKSMIVRPTHYTMRSHCYGVGSYHPKSWVLESSLDGSDWHEIDRKQDDGHLNGTHLAHTFEMAVARPARYIRITQTGPNHRGDHYFGFSALEFFGYLTK